ncbi:hypothetical protein [Saccharopolyspora gregorii]
MSTIAHVQASSPAGGAGGAERGLVLLLVFALHGAVLANRAARAADGD